MVDHFKQLAVNVSDLPDIESDDNHFVHDTEITFSASPVDRIKLNQTVRLRTIMVDPLKQSEDPDTLAKNQTMPL